MNIESILEFNQIKEHLCECAVSDAAKRKALSLEPNRNEVECNLHMSETTQARTLLDSFGTPPLAAMQNLTELLLSVEQGSLLTPEQLLSVASFITTCEQLTRYLKKAEASNLELAFYGRSLIDLTAVKDAILTVIRNNGVDDNASTELKNIRKKIDHTNLKIRQKLEKLLVSKRSYFTDHFVSIRNGHYVLPVKKEYKHQLKGHLLDVSSTGNTCFIEPDAVASLTEELTMLEIAQDNEIHKILGMLAEQVAAIIPSIRLNMEAMETLDFIFAKGKLSSDLKARSVTLTCDPVIKICNGRHPLLKRETCVPLNFAIGDGIRGVVITGPNTGGKTVALKTVGLLSLMAQCGLHVPVEEGSIFSLHDFYLCDLGDGQSISQNLSTFSAHITNVISILNQTTSESLVLLDELGTGTDPAEGMGIAIAIIQELRRKQCLFVATTHYAEVKEYALHHDDIINARMTFDRETLCPKYQLEIGEAGESCALYIAKRLGFPAHLLATAEAAAYNHRASDHSFHLPDDLDSISADTDSAQSASKKTSNLLRASDCKPANQKHQIVSKRARFQIGDSVIVYPQRVTGLIYQKVNEKGELGVQIKGKKQLISYKRLKLRVSADQLYPENYDFSTIFETVSNRKIKHDMSRKQTDRTIDYEANQNLSKYKNI